ncbi:nuclear migration protein [Diplodia corticola]|uniref:Nuclear migration protein n=1 Tax=Diplodia corticola TaxID=236234 RepID=A0A1J9QXB4_9PEZI|nr:nuclear migration protein [Diplodia corticola]OJD32626.1 nuclear migration protein [Diplodia corticola]
MATEYFSDQESSTAARSLSTPTETPFMTPQPSRSRRSSRHGTPSSFGDASQASPAPPASDCTSGDSANDENISQLDPRRFTPTLQANLVAEILNLRRELDSKHRVIEDLETNLHSTQEENELLNDKLSTSLRESRVAKRQIQQLESGTLSALEELVKERDQIRSDNEHLKSKLEASQKKARSEVDASDRTQDLWQKDKEAWDNDKRSLERRLHVTETRLKVVLDELATQQAAVEAQAPGDFAGAKDAPNGHESDTASIQSSPKKGRHRRNQSSGSARSVRSFGPRGYRASILTIGSEAHAKLSNGLSLADELSFDEEDEDFEDLETDSEDYTEHEIRARKLMEARASSVPDEKARKMLGIMMDKDRTTPTPSEPDRDMSYCLDDTIPEIHRPRHQQSFDTIVPPQFEPRIEPDDVVKVERRRVEYVDTGVQPSPPPSPRVTAQQIVAARSSGHIMAAMDVEANQRKKRVSAPPSEAMREKELATTQRKSGLMVSTSCQTLSQPLSPPETPTVVLPQSPTESEASVNAPRMASTSTQTESRVDPQPASVPEVIVEPPQSPPRTEIPAPIPIPQIAIHPPGSTPGSPKHAVLPPNTKSAGSQTTSELPSNMRDSEVQTDPILIEQRISKLPPHLLPSAISSKPGTPIKEDPKAQPVLARPFEEKGKSPLHPSTQELLKSMRTMSIQATQDKYPGNNDNGPLTQESTDGIRRPFRTSSLFAGFDGESSDEDAAADQDASSDEEGYSGHAVVVRAVKYGRMFNKPPTPVPEEKEPNSKRSSYEKRSSVEKRSSYEKPAKVEKPIRAGSIRKQPSVRRSALLQSGITAHDRTAPGEASSSNPFSKPKPPPFPVPTRSSSRKAPLSKSEGSSSPTPRSNMFTNRRSRQQQHARQDSLRKVRSAAVIRRDGRQRSRSPPPPQSSLTSPDEPADAPPLPRDRVTSPYQAYAPRHHGRHPSVSTAVSTAVSSAVNSNQSASSVQSVSVVDAIAGAMVGEWLWKYVRGRKSFGVADAVTPEFGKDDGTGGSSVRHKRWVWISPYERAIMWSSKQPTSGTALMGKTGRKLQIQSVLDVKDDTPAPKGVGAQPIFNRSILILTPARALKFTATSAERHYLWLTALSFLAHSSQAVPDLNQLPAAPTEESPQTKRSTAALGRRPITNSVRLAKQNQGGLKGYVNRAEPIYEGQAAQSPVSEAATPPVIHRHGRKRSMTSPRQAAIPPPIPGNPFTRSFSANSVYSGKSVHSTSAVPPPIPTGSYSSAASSVGMSDLYSPGGTNIPPSVPSSIYNPSRRTSEASSSAATAAGTRRELYDPSLGTVRMEAFVEPRLSLSQIPGGGFPGLAPSFREKSAARQYRKNSQYSVKSGMTGSDVASRAPSQASGKYSSEHGSDLFRGFE